MNGSHEVEKSKSVSNISFTEVIRAAKLCEIQVQLRTKSLISLAERQ